MPHVTMQQIATAAGVSKMTVSRALKDHPYVSPELRARIGKLAHEMGYRTHPYVSALMSGLAQTRKSAVTVGLAVLHFDTLKNTLSHTYYQGICERAHTLGYNVIPFHYHPARVTPARLRSILIARGIRGIVLMPAPEGFTSIDFDFSDFAAATLGHTIVHPPLPRVAGDIYTGTFQALDELTRRGYTRIGLVNTDYVNRLARFLYTAALLAYRARVAPQLHLVEHIVAAPIRSRASLAAMKRWILNEKLEVVICPAFDLPLYDILTDQGFKIPEHLSYLHLLDYPNPRVTSLNHMGHLLGAKAVDLVTAMINRNEFQTPAYPQTVSIPSRWDEGATTPFLKSLAPA